MNEGELDLLKGMLDSCHLQLRDREAELADKDRELKLKHSILMGIEEDLKIMKNHISELDNNNALYQIENSTLTR